MNNFREGDKKWLGNLGYAMAHKGGERGSDGRERKIGGRERMCTTLIGPAV